MFALFTCKSILSLSSKLTRAVFRSYSGLHVRLIHADRVLSRWHTVAVLACYCHIRLLKKTALKYCAISVKRRFLLSIYALRNVYMPFYASNSRQREWRTFDREKIARDKKCALPPLYINNLDCDNMIASL